MRGIFPFVWVEGDHIQALEAFAVEEIPGNGPKPMASFGVGRVIIKGDGEEMETMFLGKVLLNVEEKPVSAFAPSVGVGGGKCRRQLHSHRPRYGFQLFAVGLEYFLRGRGAKPRLPEIAFGIVTDAPQFPLSFREKAIELPGLFFP